MKEITFVVAMTDEGVIGNDNQLLWHLPNDLKRFKTLTMGKPIIMGRKTYESIGKPLPGRENIILTRSPDFTQPGCDIVHSVAQVLSLTASSPEIMIIGGGEIYQLFLPVATKLYITYVHANLRGEVSFKLNKNNWQEIAREECTKDEKHHYDYSFVTLVPK